MVKEKKENFGNIRSLMKCTTELGDQGTKKKNENRKG